MKSLLLATLALLGTACAYDLYRQCDERWDRDIKGTGEKDLCSIGGDVSSLAMLLDDCDQDLYGFDVNPGTLNRWLKENNGYQNGNDIIWNAINKLSSGVQFVTLTTTAESIQSYLDRGNGVLLQVGVSSANDPHYVLAYGYSGSTYYVMDPRNQRRSFKTSEVNKAVIYTRPDWCKN